MDTILWDLLLHDLDEIAVGILGDAPTGSHPAVMTGLLHPLSGKDLSQLAHSAELCSFGSATGLARASHCLSAVSTSPTHLRLQRSVVDSLLRNVEPTRLGTEIKFPWHDWPQASSTRPGCLMLASAIPSQPRIWKGSSV